MHVLLPILILLVLHDEMGGMETILMSPPHGLVRKKEYSTWLPTKRALKTVSAIPKLTLP
jgi:hypothetical protein